MPGFLEKPAAWLLNHKRFSACMLAGTVFAVAFFAVGFWPLSILVLVGMAALVVNKLVNRKLYKQVHPFWERSGVRNLDCLVIGDMCDAEALASRYCTGGVLAMSP